jgi:beta-glucanase (GH16 family)
MGNLARPGYGGTTDGMWPYSYDTCDIGTLPNQTLNGKLNSVVTRFSKVILNSETQHRVSTYL